MKLRKEIGESVESKVKMLLFMLFTADCLQIKLRRIWHMNSNCPK